VKYNAQRYEQCKTALPQLRILLLAQLTIISHENPTGILFFELEPNWNPDGTEEELNRNLIGKCHRKVWLLAFNFLGNFINTKKIVILKKKYFRKNIYFLFSKIKKPIRKKVQMIIISNTEVIDCRFYMNI
jgi:hypothetical protein